MLRVVVRRVHGARYAYTHAPIQPYTHAPIHPHTHTPMYHAPMHPMHQYTHTHVHSYTRPSTHLHISCFACNHPGLAFQPSTMHPHPSTMPTRAFAHEVVHGCMGCTHLHILCFACVHAGLTTLRLEPQATIRLHRCSLYWVHGVHGLYGCIRCTDAWGALVGYEPIRSLYWCCEPIISLC